MHYHIDNKHEKFIYEKKIVNYIYLRKKKWNNVQTENITKSSQAALYNSAF